VRELCSDARPIGGAHGLAHLWDNGANASDELKNILRIRAQAIKNFSKDNIRAGEPYSVLEDVFVPLYFFHRYQTEAAVKLIGGLNYNYATKGDQQKVVEAISVKKQKDALVQVLQTLLAEVLAIPEDKLKLFPPRAFGYNRTRESFNSKTGVAFDALSAASTASNMSLLLLLHPERMSRLIQQKSLDPSQLGASEVISELIKKVFETNVKNDYHREIQQMVMNNTLEHLMSLYIDNSAYPQVQAIALASLRKIEALLSQKNKAAEEFYNNYYLKKIQDFMSKPEKFKAMPTPKIPDGSPIGSFRCEF